MPKYYEEKRVTALDIVRLKPVRFIKEMIKNLITSVSTEEVASSTSQPKLSQDTPTVSDNHPGIDELIKELKLSREEVELLSKDSLGDFKNMLLSMKALKNYKENK